MSHLKPRILQDVYQKSGKGTTPFRLAQTRLNLRHTSEWRIPFSIITRTLIIAWASWALVLGAAVAPTTQTLAAGVSEEERARLEAQLKELETQIDAYEGQISGYQKQGKSLSGEIGTLNSKIAKLNLQIKAIDLSLKDLDSKIVDTQDRIQDTEASLNKNQVALAELIKNLHATDKASMMEVFLANPKLSDFFGNLNNISLLQNSVRDTIAEMKTLQSQLKNEKEQYALARADAATIKQYQAAQKIEADKTKQTKNSILVATKGQEAKYQTLLKQTEATAAQIRARIFSLLGGGQISFGDAYQYAKTASNATGVRASLILAVLDRESALGKNVGRCSYQSSMSPANQPVYLQIVNELGIDPDSVKVSCAILSDGAYGGAMGPAQFMPTTWTMYKDRIAAATGNNPPSPWNNADAFMATALYMKDAGAGPSIEADRKAAARYYAGGNWSRYLWTYGQAVVSRAAQFEADIATLIGN